MLHRLKVEDCIFLCCDMQTEAQGEYNIKGVLEACCFMLETAGIFQIPVLQSMHSPQIFGYTFIQLKETADIYNTQVYEYEKLSYSMINEEAINQLDSIPNRKVAVIFGVQTHCCIAETCYDLIERGFRLQKQLNQIGYIVHLVCDATTAPTKFFRQNGIEKLKQNGVRINNSQSVLFELQGGDESIHYSQTIGLFEKYKNLHSFE